MSAYRTQGIGVRLVFPLAVVAVLLAAGLVALQLRAASRSAAEELDAFADLVGGVVLNGVHDAMLADDRPRLKQDLLRLASQPAVRRIDIVDKEGRVAFSSDPSAVGEQFRRDSPTCLACHDEAKPPRTTGRTVHYPRSDGTTVFRFVQPIAAELECLECHEKARVGQNLGILITDLDEARLTARQLAGARGLSWALLGAFGLLLGSVAVIVRLVVVERLKNVKRVVEFVRSGALASASDRGTLDEIDEIERLVRLLAEDVEDRHALQRASDALANALDQCSDPALLTDGSLRLLGASSAFRRLPRAPWKPGADTPLVLAQDGLLALVEQARVDGWALGEGEGAPLIAKVENAQGEAAAFLGVWPGKEGQGAGSDVPVKLGRTDPEWRFYTAALISGLSEEPGPWRGVLKLDRRLTSGKKLLSDLAAAAARLSSERAEVDLRAMVQLELWDVGRQLPQVSWYALLGERHVVHGARYQLRALVRRLGEAAATQAGPGGHAVLFTQTRDDQGKVYLGAWACSEAPPVPLDGPGAVPLCELVAKNHGGAVEVNRVFDIGPLCRNRGVELPCKTSGVLFVAELSVRPARKKSAPTRRV